MTLASRASAARAKYSVEVAPSGTPATPLSVGGAVYHQPRTSGITFSQTPVVDVEVIITPPCIFSIENH
jgi:hypothetical protein